MHGLALSKKKSLLQVGSSASSTLTVRQLWQGVGFHPFSKSNSPPTASTLTPHARMPKGRKVALSHISTLSLLAGTWQHGLACSVWWKAPFQTGSGEGAAGPARRAPLAGFQRTHRTGKQPFGFAQRIFKPPPTDGRWARIKCIVCSSPCQGEGFLALCPFIRKERVHLIFHQTDKGPKTLFLLLNLVVQTCKVNKKLAINNMKSSLPREGCRAALIN